MGVTKNQQDAIEHEGNLLIVAGPGSGKTATSVAKAKRILSDPSRSLIMVTFTKEGAEEIRKRLDAELSASGGPAVSAYRLRVGTFHSIALQHLYLSTAREKVLGPAQQTLLFNDAMGPFKADPERARGLQREFESFMYAIDRNAHAMSAEAQWVVERYTERLTASRATDLYTVMRNCALYASSGKIKPLPFTDMVVDEAQDIDELQRVWIFAHARSGTKVTIVGDDDQSIYEWRNALGYTGMKSFLEEFGAKRIELGDNFRCRHEVLAHAVRLISHNTKRLRKELVAQRGPGGTIACYHTPSSETQCDELAELISLTPDQHVNAAVLARKNRSLNDLEMALTQRQVAYVRLGKSIWDDIGVATYIGLLQSLVDSSPVGVYGCLDAVGLDQSVKTEILKRMRGSANSFLEDQLGDLNFATPTDVELIRDFAKACKYWRNQLRSDAGGSVDEVVLDAGQWLASKQPSRYGRETINRAASILAKLKGTLSSRLNFISRSKRGGGKDAAVTLMTMHASKGMEFDTVHVIDANKPDDGSDLANEEGERRLAYVAWTRARNRCLVWYSGEPHPTIREGGLKVLHQFNQLTAMVTSGID